MPPTPKPDRARSARDDNRARGGRRPSDGPPSWNRGGGKMAEELARALEADIVGLGWPVGETLGSEGELIERFGVSRAVFREAVRIVEHHGSARAKRGPGGGLIVTAPDPSMVVGPVALYLDYADVSAQDLFDVRSALELTCARIAAETIDEAGIARLRAVLERERELGLAGIPLGHPHEVHIAIAKVTKNPAMHLFVEIMTQLTFQRTGHLPFGAAEFEAVHRAHVAIVEAIVSGDGAVAQHRVKRHLAASTAYYHGRGERESPDSRDE